jgi:hypothetical protein
MIQVAVKKIRWAEKSHIPSIGSEDLFLQNLQNSDSLHKKIVHREAIKTAGKQPKPDSMRD